jgi:UDP-N-acetylglucosamine 2-epimerase (non-hydrolysing)
MKPARIACVFGTRPETIKMAPVIQALQHHPRRFQVDSICTGQHRELLSPLIAWFGLTVKLDLAVMRADQTLNALCARLLNRFGQLFARVRYDCVIGQGDTSSVLCAALAAFHEKIPFVHVEAGLRTFDRNYPFPEEINRGLVGRLARLHFAPTARAAENLRREGVEDACIHLIGNTVIDALQHTAARVAPVADAGQTVLVTAHRRENHGAPLLRICHAIRRLAHDSPRTTFVFAVHPHPEVSHAVHAQLSGLENVRLVAPMPYPEWVRALQQCHLVLTDSGGLQEEAPALGKPVLVLREETERPELVELGGSRLVGSDEARIHAAVMQLLNDAPAYQQMVIGASPYGDGQASQRLVQHLDAALESWR